MERSTRSVQGSRDLDPEELPLTDTAAAVGCILAQVVASNEASIRAGKPRGPHTSFEASTPPSITIRDYVQRISRYSQCNAQCFIIALIYIDRLIQRNPAFLVTELNVHRLFITSIVAASKYSNDFFLKNSFYAKVGGISASELNDLELEFLFRTHFDLFVHEDTFGQYKSHLDVYSAKRDDHLGGAANARRLANAFATDSATAPFAEQRQAASRPVAIPIPTERRAPVQRPDSMAISPALDPPIASSTRMDCDVVVPTAPVMPAREYKQRSQQHRKARAAPIPNHVKSTQRSAFAKTGPSMSMGCSPDDLDNMWMPVPSPVTVAAR